MTMSKPDADERAEAARRLDAASTSTLDRRLLRVLLDDDQHAFEQALVARLIEHRESVGSDPAPRTRCRSAPLPWPPLRSRCWGGSWGSGPAICRTACWAP
ncbi:Imm49 family immunity protein [Streptomyces sp. NPDC058655]|uniref:Imm49 family immunity protein n=1 Tax=Streptomyces sp. NPDC058655 TaxID=3346577 RepID=UPI003651C6FC